MFRDVPNILVMHEGKWKRELPDKMGENPEIIMP